MFTIATALKKIALVVLVLGIGMAALPAGNAFAAAEPEEGNPPTAEKVAPGKLKQAWERLQAVYAFQEKLLGKSGEMTTRIQTLIDKAEGRGLDISAVQAALDALMAVIPAAQAAHEPGAAIIASHAGFDEKGNVEELETAVQTVRSLAEVIRSTRAAMNGTGAALREAIRAFFQANRPEAIEAPAQ